MKKKKQILFAADGGGEDVNENKNQGVTPETPEATRAKEADAAFMLGALIGGKNLHRRPGLRVGSYFFSLESLLLALIAVMTVCLAVRKND